MAQAFIFMMCPAGIAVALILRYARAVPDGPAGRGDAPERLLRWAAGLLSAQREEWGQAMHRGGLALRAHAARAGRAG